MAPDAGGAGLALALSAVFSPKKETSFTAGFLLFLPIATIAFSTFSQKL